MPLLPITSPRNVDLYTRVPATPPKMGEAFAFVLALHVGLFWLAQTDWTSASLTNARNVVAAQLIQASVAPEQVKPKIAPKTPPPAQAVPANSPLLPTAISQATPALEAITAQAAPAVSPAHNAPTALAPSPVLAASARMDSCAKPRYPSASERLHEEGVVSLRFLISENGQVLSGSVEKSSGFKRLDEAALAALSLCKFRPAMVDGKPRQEWSTLRYRWELND